MGWTWLSITAARHQIEEQAEEGNDEGSGWNRSQNAQRLWNVNVTTFSQ